MRYVHAIVRSEELMLGLMHGVAAWRSDWPTCYDHKAEKAYIYFYIEGQ